jgi:hypothetical protein
LCKHDIPCVVSSSPAVNLPSGSIGLAESTDGVRFSKVKGPSSDGSLLGPTQGTGFDSLHVGIGDVRVRPDGVSSLRVARARR